MKGLVSKVTKFWERRITSFRRISRQSLRVAYHVLCHHHILFFSPLSWCLKWEQSSEWHDFPEYRKEMSQQSFETLQGIMRNCIQLFRERLSEKVHATIPKGIVGGFKFTVLQRSLKELVRKAVEMCLRLLKESNKSRFDSYSCQKQCIDHIPYYLSELSRTHFSDNLSRNSCISWKAGDS